jgi:hypothetical protein
MMLDGYRPTKTRIASGPSPDAAPKFSQCSPFSVPTARSCERRRWEASHVRTTIQGKHAAILTLDMRLGYHNMLHKKKKHMVKIYVIFFMVSNQPHMVSWKDKHPLTQQDWLIYAQRGVFGWDEQKMAIRWKANSETCPIRFIIRSQIVYYMLIYYYPMIFNYATISMIPPLCWQSRYQAFTPQLWKKHAKNLGRTVPTIHHSVSLAYPIIFASYVH